MRKITLLAVLASIALVPVHARAGGGGQLCGGPGDFNNDGYDDFVAGMPEAAGDSGTIAVLYGGANGIQDSDPAGQVWRQGGTGLTGSPGDEEFGSALAFGDFNGDGFDDLAVGVPKETGATGEGAVHVIYGGPDGLQATSPDDQEWRVDSPGVAGTDGSRFLGQAVAAGDFNGDGFADLAIGDPFASPGGIDHAGVVRVIYGSASGLQATGTGGPQDQRWTQGETGAAGDGNGEAGDRFGSALEAANFGNGNKCDLAIGAPEENLAGEPDAGGVNVLYGASGGLSATRSEFWSQASNGVGGAPSQNDRFGWALAGGDFNGSGPEDLAIGVINDLSSNATRGGSVSVLTGRSSGGLTASGSQRWHQNSDNVAEVAQAGDAFGWSLADGDFDADGRDDLAVGVPGEDVDGRDSAGKVHVFYGTSTGLRAAGDELVSQAPSTVQTPPEANDQLGYAVRAGQYGNGGTDDLVVSAPFENRSGETDAGIAHAFYGSGGSGVRTSVVGNFATGLPSSFDRFGYAV